MINKRYISIFIILLCISLNVFAAPKSNESSNPILENTQQKDIKDTNNANNKNSKTNKKKDNSLMKTKVFFRPSERDPFLSKEEVLNIEKARQAEIRKQEEERKALEKAEREKQAELERQRLYEEELKRNPAREVMDKLVIDGILGNEAIINGEIVRIGDKILGAQVVKVSSNSVTLVYKGQRFVKKLPLM